MYKGNKIIAIIPARSGSKGLPDKNIKKLNGIPMMAHSIICAKNSNLIDEIFVSTDSQIYADIAKSFGASVPFLRPSEISTDKSQAHDYLLHAINTYKQEFKKDFDYFILMQPTSPIRITKHIFDVIKILIDEKYDSVISVCEAEHIPQIFNQLPDNLSMHKFNIANEISSNRQDFGKYYRLNGSLYAMKICEFLKSKSYYIENSKAYIMDKIYSTDIDDELDFYIAEKLLKKVVKDGETPQP